MDKVVKYATKHRDDLIALKELAENQKVKISCLRSHRNELFDEIDKINLGSENDWKYKIEQITSLVDANKQFKEELNDKKEEFCAKKHNTRIKG